MLSLPIDVLLHIFSFLPLVDLIKTQKEQSLNFYSHQELLARIKRDQWSILFQTPSEYFSLLCNRDTPLVPIVTLTCVGYQSISRTLRFVSNDTIEMAQDTDFLNLRIYCKEWIHLVHEDNPMTLLKIAWRPGKQERQMNKDVFIAYSCIKSVKNTCRACGPHDRCHKHAFLSTPTAMTKNLLRIHTIRVSLDWLNQGFIV